jgi:hypothetical protein
MHIVILSSCDDPATEYPFQHVILTTSLLCKTNPKRQDLRELYKTVTRLYWFFKIILNNFSVIIAHHLDP